MTLRFTQITLYIVSSHSFLIFIGLSNRSFCSIGTVSYMGCNELSSTVAMIPIVLVSTYNMARCGWETKCLILLKILIEFKCNQFDVASGYHIGKDQYRAYICVTCHNFIIYSSVEKYLGSWRFILLWIMFLCNIFYVSFREIHIHFHWIQFLYVGKVLRLSTLIDNVI